MAGILRSRVWERTALAGIGAGGDIGRVWERSATSLDRAPRMGRVWDSTTLGEPASSPSRPSRFKIALGVVAGLAIVGSALAIDHSPSRVATMLQPSEPAVAAEDLAPGAMYHVVDQIGARELWNQGYTGAGVNVAVIDTGIAPVESLSGDGKVVAVVDFSSESGDPATQFVDSVGHGTHMAGIIAGAEPGSEPALAEQHPEWFLGVAPDAGIVSVKVADRSGDAAVADVVSGIDWVIDHAAELDIKVLTLAYSSGSMLPYSQDPITAAVERAWQAGLVVVTAAGNEGIESDGLASPADDPYVIAVGAADVAESGVTVADFSSRGDGVRNPDFVAPGKSIQSLRAPGSDADINHPEGYVDDATFLGSGSSQSAAVTAGAAALLLEARPELTNDQVKAALSSSADRIAEASAAGAGTGFLRVDRAVEAVVGDVTQTFTPAVQPEVRVRTEGVSRILDDARWSGSSWSGSSWSGSSWSGSSWSGSSWSGSSWSGSSWSGSSWSGSSWSGSSWSGSSWSGSSWSGSSWSGSSWSGSSWSGSSWSGSSWSGSSWSGSSWSGSSWSGSSWSGSSWSGSSWSGSSWSGSSWSGSSWSGSSWSGSSWSGSSWSGSSWS
jgi:serine protease AprX